MLHRHASADMLFAEASRRGLEPRWETLDGLFSFVFGGKRELVYYTQLHANSQLGAQICKDKSLTRAVLAAEGFRNIPFCYSNQEAELNRFFDAHHPLIQKPLLGMKAAGVRLIRERAEMDLGALEDSIFEKYVEGTEHRCLVLQGRTVAVQRKDLVPTQSHPWKKQVTNLPEDRWPADLPSTAESVAALLHMGCIAVDFLVDAAGTAWILELNGMPALHAFHHPHAGEPVDAAGMVVEMIMKAR